MSDCLFCRIVAGEIPAERVAENDAALSFRDINPAAPTHVLVIPRTHLPNLAAVGASEPDTLVAMLALAQQVAEAEGIDGDGDGQGYRLVANTGPNAHQTVFHAHLHVLGGRRMGWPPG
ncbi:MAG TPA: HIT domain-containing protein [Mycobacteriales bacterium]|nr:HIT domain-containing protein [Mycobacteriales bacterium]